MESNLRKKKQKRSEITDASTFQPTKRCQTQMKSQYFFCKMLCVSCTHICEKFTKKNSKKGHSVLKHFKCAFEAFFAYYRRKRKKKNELVLRRGRYIDRSLTAFRKHESTNERKQKLSMRLSPHTHLKKREVDKHMASASLID